MSLSKLRKRFDIHDSKDMSKKTKHINILKVTAQTYLEQEDQLAIEEPLEIQVEYGTATTRQRKNISITMRTPGNDAELAIGFLFTEGIIQSNAQVKKIHHIPRWDPEPGENTILIELKEDIEIDLKKLERHFYTTSSCGVCGKASIEAIYAQNFSPLPINHPIFKTHQIHHFPKALLEKQSVFANTGGLHAAALFDTNGKLHLLREDVGRHNAVDKLVGAALMANLIPLHDYLILVSGRVSFELIQKSVMAGLPILAAVGAPSSLAVQLAEEVGMTVLGFVREERFNVYTHQHRLQF